MDREDPFWEGGVPGGGSLNHGRGNREKTPQGQNFPLRGEKLAEKITGKKHEDPSKQGIQKGKKTKRGGRGGGIKAKGESDKI